MLERLKALRRRLAEDEGIPQYMVFHNSSLKAMATKLPQNHLEFRAIEGVGDRKLEKYGDAFLSEIEAYCRESIDGKENESVSCDSSDDFEDSFAENDEIEDLVFESSISETSYSGEDRYLDSKPSSDDELSKEQGSVSSESCRESLNDDLLKRLDLLERQFAALQRELAELKRCALAAKSPDSG
jgi:hypothetical protein